MPTGLLALALGGFGIGLTEFGIVGLLPEIAANFHTSESVAGYLVSGYALSVAVGALALTALISRLDRKKALIGLMVLFVLGNLVSALAPNYTVLLGGRLLAALCHGAFFGIGAVVAADMVAENKQASAIALMFGGLTIATVVGVPIGTFVGQQLGWRATFWALTVIGVVTMLGIQLLVPRDPAPSSASLSRELVVFSRPQIWISILLGICSFGSVVGAFTYIAFTLTDATHFSKAAVPWLLVLFGVGSFVGNWVGGKAADRGVAKALTTNLLLLAAVLVLFALGAHSKPLTLVSLFLLGAVGLATAPGLQLRVMQYGSDAPTLASGANIAALNVGNAIGAWLGGMAIAAGYGVTAPLWVGAGLAVLAIVTILIGTAMDKTSQHSHPQVAAPAPEEADALA